MHRSNGEKKEMFDYEDKVFLIEMLNENPTLNFKKMTEELEKSQNVDLLSDQKGLNIKDCKWPQFQYLGGRPVVETNSWTEAQLLDDIDFWKTMHMSKKLFGHIVQLCKNILQKSKPMVTYPFEKDYLSLKVAICVWYLVNKCKTLAEMVKYFGVFTETFLEEFLINGFNIIAQLQCSIIAWPSEKDLKLYSAYFQKIFNLENVVGVLGNCNFISEMGQNIIIHVIIMDGEFKAFDAVNSESLDSALIRSKNVLSNIKKVSNDYHVLTLNDYSESIIQKYNIIKIDVRNGILMKEILNTLETCFRHLILTFPRLLEPHKYLPNIYNSAAVLQSLINVNDDLVTEGIKF